MAGTKAVFFDIDGTLITDGLTPFKEDREAMEEAAAAGHFLFLNTGRSLANIPAALLGLPPLKGIAAGGGAHILTAAREIPAGEGAAGGGRFQTIYRRSIPGDLAERVVAWYTDHPGYCVLEGEQECYIVNGPMRVAAVKPPVDVYSPEDFRRKSKGDFITKLTMDGRPREDERLFLESFFKVNYFPSYMEAVIRGENKAKAMELVLRGLGLRREDSIAVGDGVNDIDMIRYAGLGIAVGNACAELKAAAGAVTAARCGEGGVAEALRKYVL